MIGATARGRATSSPLNRLTPTETTNAAGSARARLPVSRKTMPQTTPASARTDPVDRSMWREMIENVMAIATRASGAFWAMMAGIVRRFSHDGVTSQKSDDHQQGDRAQEPRSG